VEYGEVIGKRQAVPFCLDFPGCPSYKEGIYIGNANEEWRRSHA
jgi:hypothetical protein